jgi:hypothetical protein
MQFEQHGVYTVKVEDSILIVDATGPFNAELIAAYRCDVDACIQALSHAAWGQIIVLQDLSLFTPEAEQALERSVEFRKQNGLVASAVVSDSPLPTRWSRSKWLKSTNTWHSSTHSSKTLMKRGTGREQK